MNTPYQTVKKLTKGILKHYITDLTIHDKKLLNNYSGSFLYGFRESGTNTFTLLVNKNDIEWMKKRIEKGENNSHTLDINEIVKKDWFFIHVTSNTNTHNYLITDKLEVIPVKESKIYEILLEYYSKLYNTAKEEIKQDWIKKYNL